MRTHPTLRPLAPAVLLLAMACSKPAIYATNNVHNSYTPGGQCLSDRCMQPGCVCPRGPGEPADDPTWPTYWTSDWTMYRVFQNFDQYPPPYASPPEGLTPDDYEVSQGTSYYDASYPSGDGTGAMMEFYDKRCLPIFPIDNRFTCAFVSLGNKAYFLTYDDRPQDMPECCLFSPENHPPAQDFVKHLPYSAKDSQNVGGVMAYSLVTPPPSPPILFGYAFNKDATPDTADPSAPPYRHPQSFYFSGCPDTPPNAPIVSQNYKNFRMERPDAVKVWGQVEQKCKGSIPKCQLFDYQGRTCGGGGKAAGRAGLMQGGQRTDKTPSQSQSWDALGK